MKKLITLLLISISLIACKKNSADSVPSNTYQIGDKTYTATLCVHQYGTNKYVWNFGAGSAGLIITINEQIKSGNYIIGGASGNSVNVTAENINGHGYITYGQDGVMAQVTNENGKMSISFPKVWAMAGMFLTDSVQISANLTQIP